ncbi:MAG: hypothetical protein HQL22_12735 [Candidatus Omnitrophica bacterium]|nr:hypothetical protein [Candidatus Omnitrophota bacterium]
MTSKKFIEEVHRLYQKANSSTYPVARVRRGTQHTISSRVEDLFACYCAGKSKKGYEIWIDPQISVKGERNISGRRPFLFRPDVCIVHLPTREVRAIFDLKMDLGHKREFIQFVDHAVKDLKSKIRAHRAKCASLFIDEHEEYPLKLSPSLKWVYIICSDGNIPQDTFKDILSGMKAYKKTAMAFNIVDGHLNQKELKATANTKVWMQLDQYLASRFSK